MSKESVKEMERMFAELKPDIGNSDAGELKPRAKRRAFVMPPKRRWTENEVAFLKRHYEKKGRKFVAERLGRTTTCVAGKARLMGLCIEAHRNWTPFEDDYIRRNFGKKLSRSIARSLRRSIYAVRARASMLGVTRDKDPEYTTEERALITRLYESGVSATKIAKQVGRPETSIRTRISRWGIRSSRLWSKRNEAYLRKHFLSTSVKEIAKKLGRTESSVYHYMHRHGMGKSHRTDMAATTVSEPPIITPTIRSQD